MSRTRKSREFVAPCYETRSKGVLSLAGWRVSLRTIPALDETCVEQGYAAYGWLTDHAVESPDRNRLALVHSCFETRMGAEIGILSVFERKSRPRLIFGFDRFWIESFHHQDKWLTNDLLVVSIRAKDSRRNIGWTTYVLIDLKSCVLSVIPVPLTYAYSIRKERNKVVIDHYDDVPWFPTPSLDGMQFKIRNLPTILFEDLNRVHDVAGSLMYFLYLTDLGSHRYKHLE